MKDHHENERTVKIEKKDLQAVRKIAARERRTIKAVIGLAIEQYRGGNGRERRSAENPQ